MSRTLLKNHEHWQNWAMKGIYDPNMADGACVISGNYGSFFVDGGSMLFSHFGDTICYALFKYISASLADLEANILPDDLAALLSSVRSPFIDYNEYESQEKAEGNALAFDWNNPSHRDALKKHLWNISC